nr:hypothetical protein [Lederbergia citrisecunda]
MYWETLLSWFWVIYYICLLITVGASILSVRYKKLIKMSLITIILTVTIPIVSVIHSIGRIEGHNEVEHFLSQLQQGAIWAIYSFLGYLYIIVWWVLFFKKTFPNPK